LGNEKTLAYEPWPAYDEAMLIEAEIEIPVQINGKVRAKIRVPAEAEKNVLQEIALAEPRVVELLAGKELLKAVVVPGRMVNFVVKG